MATHWNCSPEESPCRDMQLASDSAQTKKKHEEMRMLQEVSIYVISAWVVKCVLPTKKNNIWDEPLSSWPWEVAMTVQKTHPSLMSTRSMAPYLAWWTMGLTLPWSNMAGKYNMLYDLLGSSIWVNYNNSPTWVEAIWDDFPYENHDSSEGEQWGRNIIYPDL